ncbi:MAG: DUF2804 family protein [Syntrophomonadaceae bacterium]|nr:DUF2804 family protein [Syntrophomonadaceae bacterium]
MQNEITASIPLLDASGYITQEGWARHPYWIYDRSKIHAPWWRIKEWDYFAILSQDKQYGLTLTMSDLGYAGVNATLKLGQMLAKK